jgi:hypothetical protein
MLQLILGWFFLQIKNLSCLSDVNEGKEVITSARIRFHFRLKLSDIASLILLLIASHQLQK